MTDRALQLVKGLGPWAKVAGYLVAIAAALGILWTVFAPTLRAWVEREANAATSPVKARMDEHEKSDAAFRAETRQAVQAVREEVYEGRKDMREVGRLIRRLTGTHSERLDQPLPPLAPLPVAEEAP